MVLDSFATARLLAEQLTSAHWLDLRRMDQDADMMAMLGGPRDEAGTRHYLESNLAHWTKYGFGLWILREAGSGTVAGRACVRHLTIEGGDEIEVGYGFFPEFWGRGLATEVAQACVELGLIRLRWPSVVGITLPANLGSQRVLRKAGLAYEREFDHAGIPHLLFRKSGDGFSAGRAP